MRVLVVDDSRAMRSLIRRTLRQAGFSRHEVVEASDGLEALTMVKENRPHFILADWNMPRLNGLDLLRVLKEAEFDIPVGLITAEHTVEKRREATEAGAKFIIAKPFTVRDFENVLGPFLS
ncbi:MAG: response regulator [Myxococcota bacterium]|nr:response regulator [Myxococcota bacterium]